MCFTLIELLVVIAVIAITTSNSISVNVLRFLLVLFILIPPFLFFVLF